MTFRAASVILAGIVSLALAACHSPQPNEASAGGAVENPPAVNTPVDTASRDSALYAAAEPFEALTEQAATASSEQLGSLRDDARTAAAGVATSLGAAENRAIDGYLAAVDTAMETGDRSEIALSAVEGYRTLVEATSGSGSVPRNVSLLDYAGFRYQADLAAKPIRWDDATAALGFADQQWAGLQEEVMDESLRNIFDTALGDLRAATDARDATRARAAVAFELNLVDMLEHHFDKNA